MTTRHRRLAATAAGAVLALGLAACGGGGGGPGPGASSQPQGGGAQPKKGGTLTFVGKGDVDHLDPTSAYYTTTSIIERAWTRQLVTYPTTTDINKAGKIVPDVATQVPTQQNGGISSDGLTYTFHIKKGVKWDAPSGARQVTAQDFARGLERTCNPAHPTPALSYYTKTIKGMPQFCDGFTKVKPPKSASAIAAYTKSHDVSGVKVKDDLTLQITLQQPTVDFLNIMALGFASAAPKEYLKYVPDEAKFRQNTISDGPYEITTYQHNKKIVLERNPAWDQKTDNVRHAYVDKIVVNEGVGPQQAFQQIMAGTADVAWDQPPPTSQLPQLFQTNDRRLEVAKSGLLNPYVVFNEASGPTTKLKVRQAIAYAIDKPAVAQIYGGPKLNINACQILPPTSSAHQDFCLYPSKDGKGNIKKAKQLLAEAGYPNGLKLNMIFRTAGVHPKVAQTIQASLKRAGIDVHLKPVPQADFYSQYLEVSSTARRGVWNIATPGWAPDWFGNNARVYLQPLFDSTGMSRSDSTWGTNFGFYHNPKVNTLIHKGAAATSLQQADTFFHQAEVQIMKDAAIAPILWQKQYWIHSNRVHGWAPYPNVDGDPTNMWLSSS